MNLDEEKYNLLSHFMEFDHDIRLNPLKRLNEEEETLLIMYIQETLPYLEIIESSHWSEFIIRIKGKIPIEDQLFYYKNRLDETSTMYSSLYSSLHSIMEKF